MDREIFARCSPGAFAGFLGINVRDGRQSAPRLLGQTARGRVIGRTIPVLHISPVLEKPKAKFAARTSSFFLRNQSNALWGNC